MIYILSLLGRLLRSPIAVLYSPEPVRDGQHNCLFVYILELIHHISDRRLRGDRYFIAVEKLYIFIRADINVIA